MRFFENVGSYILRTGKALVMWDIKHLFTAKHYVKIGSLLILNIINAFAKILAPLSLAKAMEMIAIKEDDYAIGPVHLNPTQLLYVSVILMVWVKSEIFIKKFILNNFASTITQKNISQIIAASHQLDIEDHLHHRTGITTLFAEVITDQSKLAHEVLTVLYPVILDISVGTSIIWLRYGHLIGGEFLGYCVLDILFLSHLIDYITKQTTYFSKMSKSFNKLINREFEILNSVDTVRMFNHEALENELSQILLKKYVTINDRFQFLENFASTIKNIPVLIANIIPITLLLKEEINIYDIDDVIFLVGYVNLFGSNMRNFNQSLLSVHRAEKSIKKMQDLIALVKVPRLLTNTLTDPLYQSIELKYTSPTVEFENVVFSYPNCSTPIFKKINFKIFSGAYVGIIGRSSAGKSTIVKLLYGMYRPSSGSIKINGQDITGIPTQVLCKIFCCVPQMSDLFKDKSLKYNVLYGNNDEALLKKYLIGKYSRQDSLSKNYQTLSPAIDEEIVPLTDELDEANEIFSKAMCNAELSSLVNTQADTKKSTQSLSGGQRQRVGIARALARSSSILIFDEPTSALDSFTEADVLRNIKRLENKTKIMITHRLSTIKDADEVIVIEDGQVIEQGSPAQLLKEQGYFYDCWQMQQGMS